jgi:hypothetical protein
MPEQKKPISSTPWFFECPNCGAKFTSADYFDHLDQHSNRNLDVYLSVQDPVAVLDNLLLSEAVRADIAHTLCHSRQHLEALIVGLAPNKATADWLRTLLLPPRPAA